MSSKKTTGKSKSPKSLSADKAGQVKGGVTLNTSAVQKVVGDGSVKLSTEISAFTWKC